MFFKRFKNVFSYIILKHYRNVTFERCQNILKQVVKFGKC